MLEVNYVSVAEAALRDRVAPVYNHVGTVKNGERVEVLEREKRFSRVRTAGGAEGWIEQRYLVDQQTYDALQKLTQENLNDPVQSPGVLRNETNLHITPSREAEHLYQLPSGARVSILKRATAEKQPGTAGEPAGKTSAKTSGGRASSGPVFEDWWLVRDADKPRGVGAGPDGGSRRSDRDCTICRRPAYRGIFRAESGARYRQGGQQARTFHNICASSPNRTTVCLTTTIRFASSPGT